MLTGGLQFYEIEIAEFIANFHDIAMLSMTISPEGISRIETYTALEHDSIVLLCYCEVIHGNKKHGLKYCLVSI